MRHFLAHFLFVLAAWTLVIKFAFPIAMAANEDRPLLDYVWWDFWWVAHIWLGIALLTRPAYTVWLAIIVSVVEIGIVVYKLYFFFGAPTYDIWHTNWMINKLFVLAVFVLLLTWLGLWPGALRQPSRAPSGTGLSGTASTTLPSSQ